MRCFKATNFNHNSLFHCLKMFGLVYKQVSKERPFFYSRSTCAIKNGATDVLIRENQLAID